LRSPHGVAPKFRNTLNKQTKNESETLCLAQPHVKSLIILPGSANLNSVSAKASGWRVAV
jgi:hypothetical protein